MPRNTTGLTQKQRTAVVDAAHRHLSHGASVSLAASLAGESYGVSPKHGAELVRPGGTPACTSKRKGTGRDQGASHLYRRATA